VPVAQELMPKLLGTNDANIRFLEEEFNTTIITREASLLVNKEVAELVGIILELVGLCQDKNYLDHRDIETVLRLHRVKKEAEGLRATGVVVLENAQVAIKTRTTNQANYIRAMEESELVFSIGPAGTGKTFLAVAWAINLLERGAVEKIVLVKPAVEAGEKLGFLPGDIKEKVDPYFRPLYDALLYMLPYERVKKYVEQSVIEIAPLAYMRGRTLNYAFAILDEAQNTSGMQMKMFLTRLGPHSRAVVTGDLTQIDLEKPETSGLLKVQTILKGIKGIEFVYLDANDVVRHRLVAEIILAYDKYKS
jgi:phosphate starvation-inducible PhoH-like protein